MIVGLYTSASGMLAEQGRHEAIANNVANVSTAGFKRDDALIRTEPSQALHRLDDNLLSVAGMSADLAPSVGVRGDGAVVDAILPNFRQGSPMETGNPLDLALEGEGFFAVQTPRGRRYTRAGNFTLDGQGTLVTQDGDAVLTDTGAKIQPGNRKLEIGRDGTLTLDGVAQGRLGVLMPDHLANMVKEGANLYSAAAGTRFRAATAGIAQGTLERSNVNAVLEMADLIEVMRAYEANQKAIIAQDETVNTLITQVGRFG